jgi:DNA-directed RNA polymerase subunit K/omega
MDEEKYTEMISEMESSYDARLSRALEELEKGKVQEHKSIDDLMNTIESETE